MRVNTRAREPEDATSRALDAIDQLRALWNLFLTFRKWRITIGGMGSPPVNVVVLGPIHTLHHPTGKAAFSGHWWDPTYIQPISATDVTQGYAALRRFEHRARSRLANSPLGEELVKTLLQYVRALDDRFLNSAFLKLWGVLEVLTATSNTSHEVTARRASFLYKDVTFRRLSLGYLREWRNRIAHRGDEAEDAEGMVYELKSHVDALIRFLFDHPQQFRSLEEFGSFLDLPTEGAILRERMASLMLASRLADPRSP